MKDIPASIPVFELGSLSSVVVFWRMLEFLRKHKPDLFISNLSRFNVINLLARFVSRSTSKMMVVEHTQVLLLAVTARTFLHRIFAFFFFPWIASFLYKKAHCVVAVSHGVANDLKKILGDKTPVQVLYNPVVEKKMKDLAKEDLRWPWVGPKNLPVVLSVGRLVKAKNYGLLLKAVRLVLEKRAVKLVMVGDGEDKKDLEDLALSLNIKDSIYFVGFEQNPFKYMARADVFVSSSMREGFGNTIVEAMALGLPVVATDCPGPAEIIQDAGVLVPRENISAMAEAILKVLEDSSFRARVIERGLQRANDFLVETSVKNYEKVFDELLHT